MTRCENCDKPGIRPASPSPEDRICYACRHTYRARLSEAGQDASVEVPTLAAARAWAESFGNTADRCIVTTLDGREVAMYQRDPNGDGMSWYRASL